MCSISGVITTNNSLNAKDLVVELCKLQVQRGNQGCGITWYSLNNYIKPKIFKQPVDPLQFSTPKIITKMCIGHTRQPTSGSVNYNNTHPHKDCSESISLVHNGVLGSSWELAYTSLLPYHPKLKGTSDSCILPHLLETYIHYYKCDMHTALELLSNGLGYYHNVIALLYNGEVYLCGNGDLTIVRFDDKIVFASDQLAIKELLGDRVFTVVKPKNVISIDNRLNIKGDYSVSCYKFKRQTFYEGERINVLGGWEYDFRTKKWLWGGKSLDEI